MTRQACLAVQTDRLDAMLSRLQLTGIRDQLDNLLDEAPARDKTYGGYPYYDISWFDATGRTYFLELNYNFGGK